MKKRINKLIKDENGQAMIELVLLLPFFFLVMMLLIFVYSLNSNIIRVQKDMSYLLLKKVAQKSRGAFQPISVRGRASVEVPGKLKRVLGQSFVRVNMKLNSFAGAYQGKGRSKYMTGRFFLRRILWFN